MQMPYPTWLSPRKPPEGEGSLQIDGRNNSHCEVALRMCDSAGERGGCGVLLCPVLSSTPTFPSGSGSRAQGPAWPSLTLLR